MGTEILGEVKPILTVSGGRAEFIGAVISPDDIATITKLDGLEISGNVTFTNNESKIIIEGDVSLNNSLDVNGNIKLKGIHEGSQLKALYYNTTTGEITYDNSGNTQLLSVIEGTASASKALVVDSNRDIGNIGNITITGQINGPSSLIIDPAGVGDNTGLVVIKGGLQVDGSSTIINSSTLDISDHRILLSNNSTHQSQTNGAGIEVSNNKLFVYNYNNDNWNTNIGLNVSGVLIVEDDVLLNSSVNISKKLLVDGDAVSYTHLTLPTKA